MDNGKRKSCIEDGMKGKRKIKAIAGKDEKSS